MVKKRLNTEEINSFIEAQLALWPLASENFSKLKNVERKNFKLGDLIVCAQWNPGRIVSTGAKVDKKTIESRPCFLCKKNRPPEQYTFDFIENWEFLINPYPILPVHFTISNTCHVPQGKVPMDMAVMAELAPYLVFFYNGAKAGASAPDHQHVQAVLASELPLLNLVEKFHPVNQSGFLSSEEFGLELPFHFISSVILPDLDGMINLKKITGAFGLEEEKKSCDSGLINAFFWLDKTGILRALVIPRKRHRPDCYFARNEDQMIISPGAIDMSGLLIVPRKEDFDKITEKEIRQIYSDVSFSGNLPSAIKDYFGV